MVSMQAWVTLDADGHEALVRTGSGRVTALVPLGDRGAVEAYRVEIEVDRPRGRTRAVRYVAHGLLAADDPLVVVGLQAEADGEPVTWTIEWTRHPGVPGHLPIASLELATDARAAVLSLAPTTSSTDLSPSAAGSDAESR